LTGFRNDVILNLMISKPVTKIDLNKTLNWIGRQVSPGLSVIADAYGEDKIDEIIKFGRQKRGRRYDSIVDNIDLDRGEVNAKKQ